MKFLALSRSRALSLLLSLALYLSLIATGLGVCVEAARSSKGFARSSKGFVEIAHARHTFEAFLVDVLILSRCAVFQRAIFLHFGAYAADTSEMHVSYSFTHRHTHMMHITLLWLAYPLRCRGY